MKGKHTGVQRHAKRRAEEGRGAERSGEARGGLPLLLLRGRKGVHRLVEQDLGAGRNGGAASASEMGE